MPTDYTTVYTAIAVNVSAATMAAALAAQARDTDTETLLGLTTVSDNTVTSGVNLAIRTIEYAGTTPGPIPEGDPIAQTLQGFYTATWSLGLGTPITAAPVTHT